LHNELTELVCKNNTTRAKAPKIVFQVSGEHGVDELFLGAVIVKVARDSHSLSE